MKVENFVKIIGADFYTGVPDSQLKALCNYLMTIYGINSKHHIIGANEGNCTALAAGYHLATGKVPAVYMQNSGEGNVINPIASLLNDSIYAIPVIFIIGWRGEPGIHDEPQHVCQGKITIRLLEDMGIQNYIVGKETTENELKIIMAEFRQKLLNGESVAFVIKKGALSYEKTIEYKNNYVMKREEIIQRIVSVSGDDPIISTTGKTSRELFEIRTSNRQSHKYDFLSVGSMGHSSSIALGVAINKPDTKVWCIDGDGAFLMHMGAVAIIGAHSPENMVHIVINNGAHETVGGMPTVAGNMDIIGIARACGYPNAICVDEWRSLDKALKMARDRDGLSLIEVRCAIGARENLGRPTVEAKENKKNFMEYLKIV